VTDSVTQFNGRVAAVYQTHSLLPVSMSSAGHRDDVIERAAN